MESSSFGLAWLLSTYTFCKDRLQIYSPWTDRPCAATNGKDRRTDNDGECTRERVRGPGSSPVQSSPEAHGPKMINNDGPLGQACSEEPAPGR